MTPQEFIAKWKRASLSERSAYQQHFLDLCDVLGQPKPGAADPEGAWYTFERGVHKTTGEKGWADVEPSVFGSLFARTLGRDTLLQQRSLLLVPRDIDCCPPPQGYPKRALSVAGVSSPEWSLSATMPAST